jgi:hypothetical protein
MTASATIFERTNGMKFTSDEKKWLDDLQALLSACPSKRLGFYTIGDTDVTVYDLGKDKQIRKLMDDNDSLDFPRALEQAKAGTGYSLYFPSNVHSVAG